MPLDDVLGDLPRPDFVKMDIEAHEPPALRGLSRLTARHGSGLLVEFNPACLTVQQEEPREYLPLTFNVHSRVRAVSHFGDDETFTRGEDLMTFWTTRSSGLAAAGSLGDGSLHFDLVATRTSAAAW